MRGFTGHHRGAARLAAIAGLVVAFAGCSEKKAPDYQPPATWSVSGTITGPVVAGVKVSVVGRNLSATTGADGRYTIPGLTDGTYTVEPSLAGYAFTPATRSVAVSGANVAGQDFVSRLGLAISGKVAGPGGAGVTVTLTGPSPATTVTTATTDADGSFAFHDVVAGAYSVTPSRAGGWTFSPANSVVTLTTASVTGPYFTSIPPGHILSGRVTGALSAGVTVVLSGAGSAVAVTDGAGSYAFTGLAPGSYTATPTRPGYVFTPDKVDVAIADADVTGKDFAAAATHRIAGWISGDVRAGVEVALSGDAAATATTDTAGFFEFPGLVDGGYVVTASRAGYTFAPPSRTIALAGADATSESFVATKTPTYSVTGAVSGAVLAGVTMTLQGPSGTMVETTDGTGAFAFTGLPSADYMLIPTRDDYVFTPASRVFAVSGANVVGQTFVAAVSPSARTISGTVTGGATAGVSVALKGPLPATTTVTTATDALGSFAFRSLADGSYLVTPTAGGYAFTPANCLVTVNGPSVTNVQFASAAVPHAISGTVSGAVAAGVTVLLSGDAIATATTAADGSYTFPGLLNGSYTVTPSLVGYVFGPTAASITLQGADSPGVDFLAAATHRIAGHVTGDVLLGVKVTLSGAGAGDATTDATGYYAFTDLADGAYVVTPSLAGYTFGPDLLPVALAGADVTNANFTATLVPTYTVSGTVSGAVLGGVQVTLSGAAAATTTTDGGGAYSFTGLLDGSYMVVPSLAGYAFDPASRALRVNGANVAAQDFTSAVAP